MALDDNPAYRRAVADIAGRQAGPIEAAAAENARRSRVMAGDPGDDDLTSDATMRPRPGEGRGRIGTTLNNGLQVVRE